MEITKTFELTFGQAMQTKLRWFVRRSMLQYAIAVVFLTYGLHRRDASLEPLYLLMKGFSYFFALCVGILAVQAVSALIQSRRFTPRTVTFTEDSVTVNHQGETVTQNWDWIIAAEDLRSAIVMLVQKAPPFEIYLPKSKLDDKEYQVLHKWLVARGKLKPAGGRRG